jgi:hypothetical protein
MRINDAPPKEAAAVALALLNYGLAECCRCGRIVPVTHLRADKARGGAPRCSDAMDCEHSRVVAISYGRIEEREVRKALSARRPRGRITGGADPGQELPVTD